jgi:hypothetical protein
MEDFKDAKNKSEKDKDPSDPQPREIDVEELDDKDLEDVPGGTYQAEDTNIWCDSGC